jgi:F-type H+-transporting ATPase subunit b
MKRSLISIILLVLILGGHVIAAEEEGHAPTLDSEYWWSQFIKFINFGIVIGILVYFLRKPVINFFRSRAERIDNDISAASRAREEAEARLKEIQGEIERLEDTVRDIKEKAEKEGVAEKERIINKAREEAERVLASAEREIMNRIKSGRQELKALAAELAVKHARQIIADRLDSETEEKIIDRTVASIGGPK